MPVALRPGVTYCRPGDRAIFLDIRRDRYFCLSVEAERAFAALETSPQRSADDYPALRGAIDDGLLIEAGTAPPLSPCPRAPAAATSRQNAARSTTARQTALMAARLIVASVAIRHRPLHRNLQALGRRLNRVACHADDDAVDEVAAALRRCGTLITPLEQCLPRSLATAHRLLDRQARPTFVIGVKLGPFEAHAWVQCGDVVVNDNVDYVRRFTPIFVR